jgi:hypothetical protein
VEEKFLSNIKLPIDIKPIFISLCYQFIRLNYEWEFYLDLFGLEENTSLLDGTAKVFFETVEESFRYDIALTICRLSDPSKTANQENLSINTLIEKSESITGLTELCNSFKTACKPVRKYRNKIISHSDLKISLKPDDNSLPSISKNDIVNIILLTNRIFDLVSSHYGNEAQIFFLPLLRGGSDELIYWLNEGMEAYKRKIEALRKGNIPEG